MIYVTHQVEFLPAADLILVRTSPVFSCFYLFIFTETIGKQVSNIRKTTYDVLTGDERWEDYTSWKIQRHS